MSLRTRLFLALSGLVAALVVGQWWMMTSLSRELDRELDTVALAVSGSVASFFTFEEGADDTDTGAHLAVGSPELSPSQLSERLAEHEARMAELPDPSELVEVIETGDGERKFRTVVIHRELDLHSARGDGEERVKPEMRWKFETLEERAESTADDGIGGDTKAEGEAATGGRDRFTYKRPARDGGVVLPPDSGGAASAADVRIHIEHAPEARFLWLVGPESQARVPLPEGGLDAEIESFRHRMLLGSGLVLLLGLVLSAAVAHRVSAPLRRLASAAEDVGGGALGTQVDASAGDREVRATLGAFNRMSSRLAELDARARKLSALRHLGEIGDVARGLAHTLRNPLNALGLSVEELAARASDADPEGSESLASSARRQIQRMDRGIRSFLVLASPDAGSGAGETVDVGGLARDVALEALQDGGGRVRVSVSSPETGDGEGAPQIDGVEAELRAVLQALVVNAVEASSEGDEVEVWVGPGDGDGDGEGQDQDRQRAVRIEVRDRGPGLPEEVRKRLFTPHVSTKPNGSGMGLFLAHRLATERYGGSLELLDRGGDGQSSGTVAVLVLGDRVDPEAAS